MLITTKTTKQNKKKKGEKIKLDLNTHFNIC